MKSNHHTMTVEWADKQLETAMRAARATHKRRLAKIEKLSLNPPGPTLKRYERAAELRRQGKTLREIGLELGVSGTRAQQMVARAKKLEGPDRVRTELSGRSVNALAVFFSVHVSQITPELVSKGSRSRLLSMSNLGQVSIYEIDAWLAKSGMQLKP